MLRVLLLVLALMLLGVSSFTAIKAPTLFTWRLAILAGEFGHFLVLLPVGVAIFAMRLGTDGTPPDGWRWGVTLVACAAAAALFLKPAAQATNEARRLPETLRGAFGAAAPGVAPFSVRGLFAGAGGAVSAQPHVFAHAGTADALTLDFYPAVGRAGPAPCVIVVHGGGWDSGERTQFASFNSVLAGRGYAVAAVSYRLAPAHRWPAPRDDVRMAMAYLKTHAAVLGIDPMKLVLLGRSAGGHIAEAVAYEEPDPSLRGLISLYAPADLHFAWAHTPERDVLDSKKLMRQLTGGTPDTARETFEDASPYFDAGRARVPTLLMHGTIDSLVWRRQSERLAEKLAAARVPSAFVELPWATHAFDFNPRGPGGQLSTFAILWFLEAVVR